MALDRLLGVSNGGLGERIVEQAPPQVAPEPPQYTQLRALFPYQPSMAEYLIECSVRLKFFYIANPKAGCSTVIKMLQLLEAEGDMSRLPEFVHEKEKSPIVPIGRLLVSVGEVLDSDEYLKFSIVRNPYTRILSAYLDKMVHNSWERERLLPTLGMPSDGEPPSFLEFLRIVAAFPELERDLHWNSQCFLLQPHAIPYTCIGRFENISPMLRALSLRLSPSAAISEETVRVDYHATGSLAKLHDYLGRKERDLIGDIYSDDFKQFCYSLDPHFAGA